MSETTRITISINGKKYRHWHALRLTQSIYAPHEFEVQLGDDFLLAAGSSVQQVVQRFLGKELQIQLGNTTFNGYITAVETGCHEGREFGYCLLRGKSPDAKMDIAPQLRSFEDKTLTQLVESMPTRLSNMLIQPERQAALSYHVQYEETDYAFLRRLAAVYGEWFFYNGSRLVFGKYSPAKITLRYRQELQRFSIQAGIPPVVPTYSWYEREQGSVKSLPAKAERYHDPIIEAAINQLPPNKGNRYAGYDGALRSAAAIIQQRQAALQWYAESTEPGIRPGDLVTVREEQPLKRGHGTFLVSRIIHTADATGNYKNQLTGLPDCPPLKFYDEPRIPCCSPQSAVVVDNDDPEHLGRVKVRLHWQQGSTPWIPMLQPHAGGHKGFFFLPEKGEEVSIAFVEQHPEHPYVTGTCYHGKAKPDWGTAGNNLKVVATRSGHTISLDDTAGNEVITIKDKAGNIIQLDTAARSVLVEAPEQLQLKANNLQLYAKESIALHAGRDISLAAAGNVYQHANESALLSAKNIEMVADKELSLLATNWKGKADEIQVHSLKGDLELHAAQTLDIKSEEKIRMF
ncbi:type VI secretion system Vgr family protein [Chitinophaga sp. sic0106]|uniref:type VI secretion system Vgr family protein n=1 Tax=Chitinophaga sp. sic0106 TaxID=2854785 RepID=UPI001C47CB38|nr:phage baseplate assembly protein V [Chitinophaga sp. sic0106]MBV7531727.1 type VI secretion system tip protein VgrG [Chitinophaga sp. sic0106]